jgi:hypothetical protein
MKKITILILLSIPFLFVFCGPDKTEVCRAHCKTAKLNLMSKKITYTGMNMEYCINGCLANYDPEYFKCVENLNMLGGIQECDPELEYMYYYTDVELLSMRMDGIDLPYSND